MGALKPTKQKKLLENDFSAKTIITIVTIIVTYVAIETLVFFSPEADSIISLLLRSLGTIIPIGGQICILNYFLNKKNKKKIIILSDGLERAANGDLDFQLDIENAGIWAQAYDDFNKMCKELKLTQDDLEEALIAAQEASDAKTNFLSHMSHEIRTPINTVLGLNEMIIRESSEQEVKNYASDIKNAGKTLLGLINDILDFTKIESGKMEIIPAEYEISSVLNDVLNMVSVKADEKGLELKATVDPALPYMLYGDEIRIKQILLNILTNAVKYTEKGSVTLSAGYVRKKDDKIHLKFSVKDTGIGMKKESMDRLFSPFERIDMERNRSIEGSGLGMSITKQLLELMDSKLKVYSVYGEGSDFSFAIAQTVVGWKEIGEFSETYNQLKSKEKIYKESFHAPDARILVVDDTKMNLVVIRGLLKQSGIQIDTADSGKECLNLAVKNQYHVIFLDIRMPEMDGVETLHRLSALEGNKNKNVPVIALTANAISGARKEYLRKGFSDYLPKPVDSEKLEQTILKYLPGEVLREIKAGEKDAQTSDYGMDGIPDIAGLDVAMGIQSCGTAETYQNALKEFYMTAKNRIHEIRHYIRTENYNDYTVKVHALKSSARLIGAMELSEMARYLEEYGNAENIRETRQKTIMLMELYRKMAEAIGAYINKKDGNHERPVMELKPLMEAFHTIYEFVEAFDFDSADSIMGMLDEYTVPEEYREATQKLKVLLIDVARDEIMLHIKAMEEQAHSKPAEEDSIDIPDIDVESALEALGGSVEEYINILDVFTEDEKERMKLLEECIRTENIELYTVNVHSLKSSATIIGAAELSKLAETIEMAGKAGDFTYIHDCHNELLTITNRIIENAIYFTRQYCGVENPEKELGSKKCLFESMAKLERALTYYDASVASKTINRLKNMQWSETISVMISSIEQKLMMLDYDGAILLVGELLKTERKEV